MYSDSEYSSSETDEEYFNDRLTCKMSDVNIDVYILTNNKPYYDTYVYDNGNYIHEGIEHINDIPFPDYNDMTRLCNYLLTGYPEGADILLIATSKRNEDLGFSTLLLKRDHIYVDTLCAHNRLCKGLGTILLSVITNLARNYNMSSVKLLSIDEAFDFYIHKGFTYGREGSEDEGLMVYWL